MLPYERPPFKKGVGKIYEQLKIECLPLAINSGVVWPKTGKKKSGKEIIVSILSPIKLGHDKETFLKILEKNIYDELNKIN